MFKTVIITDDVDVNIARNVLGELSQVEYLRSVDEDEIIENCRDADALISLYEPITQRVMDSLPNLKFVSLASIGFDVVDVAYARERALPVSNNPNYCLEEVADHAAALILTLGRKILDYNHSVKVKNEWVYDAAGPDIHRFSERTLGLVGFGSISRGLARRLQAFGTKVVAFDPYVTSEVGQSYGVEMVSLEELLKLSDIISLHLPLNDATRGLFDEERFQQMERKPIFINCARGEIVDEKALLSALDKGLVSSVGLDVLSTENPDLETSELVKNDKVIITPHAAFYSMESMEEAQVLAAKHVKYFIEGKLEKIPLVVRV